MALTLAQKNLLNQLGDYDEWTTESKKFYKELLFVVFTCQMPKLSYSIVYKFSQNASERIYNVEFLKMGILDNSKHLKKIVRMTLLQNGRLRIRYLNAEGKVVFYDYIID